MKRFFVAPLCAAVAGLLLGACGDKHEPVKPTVQVTATAAR